MNGRITLTAAAAVIALALGTVAANGQSTATARTSGTVTLTATLSSTQQLPAPKKVPHGATAKFTATLKGTSLLWTLSFAHLSGTATVADINQGKSRTIGSVVIALCSKCKSPASGSSLLGKTVVSALESGDAYVDIHTKKNPNGEIRGQLTKKG